jgi:hypothetical protein
MLVTEMIRVNTLKQYFVKANLGALKYFPGEDFVK